MSPAVSNKSEWIEGATAHWWFAGLTAAVGAFAGLLGSVYSTDIKNAFPFIFDDGPIIWVAIGFWSALALFGVMVGLNFRGQALATTRQVDRLQEETQVLERLVRTLPPENFLERFQTAFEQAYASKRRANGSEATSEELLSAIQTNVGAIAFLARVFAGDHDDALFAANLMLYSPISEFGDVELANLSGKIRFLGEQNLDLRKALSGLLILDPETAMVVSAKTKGHDATMIELVLPVPATPRRAYGKLSGVLPGAPEAFVNPDGLSAYLDTETLASYCRDNGLFHPCVADELDAYFGNPPGNEVKSFFSLSIPSPNDINRGSSCGPIGVLNVHSNKKGLLGDKDIALFLPLVRPFILDIAGLLVDRKAASNHAPAQ